MGSQLFNVAKDNNHLYVLMFYVCLNVKSLISIQSCNKLANTLIEIQNVYKKRLKR